MISPCYSQNSITSGSLAIRPLCFRTTVAGRAGGLSITATMKHAYNFKDISGSKIGRLTVLEFGGRSESGQSMWNCKCDCGNTLSVAAGNLQSGHTISCGCYREEIRPTLAATHRLAGTPEHNSWAGMKQRCLNPKCHKYPSYGGRGITVCERWMTFENFLSDMGNRPRGTSIERKNNDGNYEPGNCIWATPKQQANNRRKRIYL